MPDFSLPPELPPDPNEGRPRYALAIFVSSVLSISFIASFHFWSPEQVKVVDSLGVFYFIPLVGALVLQSSVKGIRQKLITLALGYVAFFALMYFYGLVDLVAGGD